MPAQVAATEQQQPQAMESMDIDTSGTANGVVVQQPVRLLASPIRVPTHSLSNIPIDSIDFPLFR